MCGIAGYLAGGGLCPEQEVVRGMCDRIRHRGPDGEGCYVDEVVGLGHRRLSIIDLEGGRQPLGNEDGSVQIVFNGEIYNFQELMKDLKRRGHRFQTRSDTEVIVHLYEEVGESVPEHLNGMFAFAIWDRRRQALFLARDRFGEKPLYWTDSIPGMRFCFASELKAMTWMPGFPSRVRPESVSDFLALGYVPDPHSIYAAVRKLEPATSMTVTAEGARRQRRYWTPCFAQASGAWTKKASVEEVDFLAGDAVRSRMVSDVPLGGFLSGGVDSSTAVAYMARSAPGRVKTFSIGFTTEEFSELEYARLVAEKYETSHHEEVVTPSIGEMLGTLVRQYDEPFGDSSAIPTLYLARMTRKFVTVALSGDGADELFGGYRRYAYALEAERMRGRLPTWVRRGVMVPLGNVYPRLEGLPRVFRAKSTLQRLASTLGEAHFDAMACLRQDRLKEVLGAPLGKQLGGYSSRRSFSERFLEFADLPPLAQMQAVDWQTYLPGDILVKVDRATMAYSLESRAPWLDHRLADLAAQLPTESKVLGGTGKVLFKQLARQYIPEQLVTRRKQGFAVPMALWFRTSLKVPFERAVFRAELEPYLDMDGVRRLWASHQSGKCDHSSGLWNVLMLAYWDRVHLQGESWEDWGGRRGGPVEHHAV